MLRHVLVMLVPLVLPVMTVAAPRSGSPPVYDLIFAGGRVVDGTGSPWFHADVGVSGDRIAAIGDLSGASAKRRIDASRLVVCPGFIDMLGQSEYNVLVDNRAASKITQGITTELTGEGQSIAPLNARMIANQKEIWARYGVKPNWTTLDGYFKALQRARPAINLGTFVGAGGVRNLVIGEVNRPATPEELQAMQAAVEQAMQQGAFGLSTSLQYVPDRFASTEEIIALAQVASRYGGSYITHQRSEADEIDSSLDEVFRIAREAHIPAQIYHLKTAFKKNWGRMPAVLQRLEKARAEGLDVTANQYPWIAGSNGLDACLPIWARNGGKDSLMARLKDPAMRARIKADVGREDPSWSNQYLGAGGPSGVMVSAVLDPELKKYEGKTIEQIGHERNQEPLEALMDIVAADRANTACIIFIMNEDDVRAAMRSPLVSMCTDSPAMATDGIYSEEKSHPRAWASAALILGKYVRDEKLLTLEQAIWRMTGLPASRVRLQDRGLVRTGMAADLVAFDPETVQARATYADPLHYSEGIPFVAVNGQLVVDGGKITGARPGRGLRGPGYKPRRAS